MCTFLVADKWLMYKYANEKCRDPRRPFHHSDHIKWVWQADETIERCVVITKYVDWFWLKADFLRHGQYLWLLGNVNAYILRIYTGCKGDNCQCNCLTFLLVCCFACLCVRLKLSVWKYLSIWISIQNSSRMMIWLL